MSNYTKRESHYLGGEKTTPLLKEKIDNYLLNARKRKKGEKGKQKIILSGVKKI